jgi:uncharacterized membrane protein YidH (DUF202 family)
MSANTWITWRSVTLGTLAAAAICAIVPYNDYVVANTFFIGNYFPPALVAFFFVLVVLFNAPLHRFKPSWALSTGELTVVMIMLLIACSIPSQGLMRGLIPTLVNPFYLGRQHEVFWQTFSTMGLAEWMYPVESIAQGRADEIVTDFYNRRISDEPVPYGAWIVPLLGWGVFVVGMWAVFLSLAILLRHQWAVNERLPFPLVQLQLALLQPPEKGRAFNELFRSRAFWIGLGGVFVLQGLVGMHRYYPQFVPEISLTYNLHGVFSEPPLVYLDFHIKQSTLFFTFVGISFFVPARTSFSLWAFVFLQQLVVVPVRHHGADIPGAAWSDQHLGAAIAFLAGVLWVGRRHWVEVFRQTLGLSRPTHEEYISYRACVIILLIGLGLMLGWLIAMGAQPWVAVVIVAFTLISHLVTARVLAETGLPFYRTMIAVNQLYPHVPPGTFSARDIYMAGVGNVLGPFTSRESSLVFGMHAAQVAEGNHPTRPQRRWLVSLAVWTLLLGSVVAVVSSLHAYYRYATPIATKVETLVNPHVLEVMPRNEIVFPIERSVEGRFPQPQHNVWLHMGIGAFIAGAMQLLSWNVSWWPLAPVGYLIMLGWYGRLLWYSVLLGWLAKTLIVRFMGATGYQQAKPLFIGLIFGEALAVSMWLCVSLLLATLGYDYEVVNLLPT